MPVIAPEIEEPVRMYAEGQIELTEALDMLRQVEVKPYDEHDKTNEAEPTGTGTVSDLTIACRKYDCSVEDHSLMKKSLSRVPIGERPNRTDLPVEFDDGPVSLSDLLDPNDDEESDFDGERTIEPPKAMDDDEEDQQARQS